VLHGCRHKIGRIRAQVLLTCATRERDLAVHTVSAKALQSNATNVENEHLLKSNS
jgi:hypothetical protein